MKKKTKFSHKVMAVFLTFTFLPSLFPVNYLFASNNAPNAPEAASFEPVDATDMVNLVTGDMSYVLPLLNVPSPEGGYPLSLSYHAGIAMDQEAAWVGLGWSLNPGAINRGVNGYPDDWGKTNVNEFFYDKGFDDDIYSFSAGLEINQAISVGLGASWGSNQSFGGYVQASLGIQGTPANASASIGSNGATIGAGAYGFNASFGTNGVGIGYGSNKYGYGVGLNYSPNSGLSGGVTASGSGIAKQASVGINFNFKSGISQLTGTGATNVTSSTTAGSYDINVSSTGFQIPVYMFYIGYKHTNVQYSLFNVNELSTSGMLYPVAANEVETTSNSEPKSVFLKENSFMDVNVLAMYNDSKDVNYLIEESDKITENNLIFPNYDNYTVSAQGLSGNLSPYFYSELNLSGRGKEKEEGEVSVNKYSNYINHNYEDYTESSNNGTNSDATKKVNFTMQGAYNSFLRTETSSLSNIPSPIANINGQVVLDYVTTSMTSAFSNENSLYDGKKREGNYIETYTNKEIRENSISGFVEANAVNRSETATFLDEGIGAYQITTLDGRTYHYSLPVYNYETFYKNFKESSENINDENQNFLEIQKRTPYATHWLLTGITGPDYVDNNTNGKLDYDDYGYWVEFDYGKWTDGYIWQSPNGRYSENENEEGDITYSYSWGRKQIYYLDAVKTRTHTALFVKSLREDNKSSVLEKFMTEKWTSGEFNPLTNAKNWNKNKVERVLFGDSATLYNANGSTYIPFTNSTYYYKQGVSRYLDVPANTTLKLDKIVLLKNEEANYNKSSGLIINNDKGYFAENEMLWDVFRSGGFGGGEVRVTDALFVEPIDPIEFNINQHQNVLDIDDIKDLDLEKKAQKVIDFNYDYSLASNSPNSDATNKGRLALNRLNFRGKEGDQLIPPYKFAYQGTNTAYNADNEDNWGYNKQFPMAWSLNEIEIPTGGKIKVIYEADSYYTEAASYEEEFIDATNFVLDDVNNTLDITFANAISVSDYYQVGREVVVSYKYESGVASRIARLKVASISNNRLFLTEDQPSILFDGFAPDQHNNVAVHTHLFSLEVKSNKQFDYTTAQVNGKNGGGLRVKSLQVIGDANTITSEYVYTNPQTDKISGITSYAPSNKKIKGIPYVTELPAPMVMYGHVKIVNKDGNSNILGSTAFEFETLQPSSQEPGYIFSLGDAFRVKRNQHQTINQGTSANNRRTGKVLADKYTLYSNLGSLGRLLSVSSFNKLGHKLHENINVYKTNLNLDGEIGVNQESHKSLKRVFVETRSGGLFEETFYVSSTSKVSYPSVLENRTTIQGNISSSTSFDKYDFLTGQVLETTSLTSEGREVRAEMVPAYERYEAMGSKVDNPTNKNMLVQNAINKTLLKVGGKWETIGAGITTWSPAISNFSEEGIWRKHKSFIWNGTTNNNGVYTNFNGEDDSFNWSLEEDYQDVSQPDQWKQISEISIYDRYSMPLEVIDVNGNKAANLMGDNRSKIIASTNAGYESMIYLNAEYGDISPIQLVGRTDEKAHTGQWSVAIKDQQGFFSRFDEHTPGKYRVSVWASKDNFEKARVFDGNSIVEFNREKVIAGDWVMLNHDVELGSGVSNIYVTSAGGQIYFDDFRVHPLASSMNSYVYNEWDELTHILGPNNMAIEYRYDEMGRLEETLSEVEDFSVDGSGGFKKSSEINYNYKY
ncbi:hypothetical protein D9V96_020430 [Zobellia laminariae]|uniref:hypothetical protein n=1 Tax=Zobellia laminariae TaxID=248906 RepID=UPI001396A8FB